MLKLCQIALTDNMNS